jgi:hypothetical protein
MESNDQFFLSSHLRKAEQAEELGSMDELKMNDVSCLIKGILSDIKRVNGQDRPQ